MKKEKNAFTLVELLSVIVILGITFMFILPSLTELFTMGNKTETELIEEKVLSAAKEYVNKIDGTFYTKLYKEGDANYIYKSDLINAGLITEEEVSKLNTFAGVKGEVLKNDRIRYTVEYINASNNEYTNEELYLMMNNLIDRIDKLEGYSVSNTKVNEIIDKVDNITNKVNNIETNITMLKIYPVGSIYISENSTSPAELFGGTWVQLKDRFLLGAGSTYTAGSFGGESEHILTIDEMPSHSHDQRARIQGYSGWNTYTTTNYTAMFSYGDAGYMGFGTTVNSATVSHGAYTFYTGGSSAHNNMPPYITVYMWKRTA